MNTVTLATVWNVLTRVIFYSGIATITVALLKELYDIVYMRIRAWQSDDDLRKRNQITILKPDQHGRHGLAWDGRTYRNLDTLAAFTQDVTLALNPVLEELRWLHNNAISASRVQGPETLSYHYENVVGDRTIQQLPGDDTELLEPGDTLPRRVPLRGLLDDSPSWRRLILGVATVDGHNEPVIADLSGLVHVAVGGSTGWGKSVFLRSIAYQLACSSDPCDLAMIDLESSTLAPFQNCGRLLWPVADNERDAAAVLRELTGELDRRKSLFAEYSGVDSLSAYNTYTDEHINPLVCIIDEATALFENKEIEKQIRTLALRARKYGLWLWLAGQDWKASTLDSAIRNQLATRVQFKAMSKPQSRVLLQNAGAEEIDIKGRALAWIPGRNMLTIQAPYIGANDIMAGVSNGGPKQQMPDVPKTEEENQVMQMHNEGMSDSAIAGALWHSTTYYIKKVRAILQQQQQNDDVDLE